MGGVDAVFLPSLKNLTHLVGIEKGHLATFILKINRKLTKQDALNKKQQPLTLSRSERLSQFKFLIQKIR